MKWLLMGSGGARRAASVVFLIVLGWVAGPVQASTLWDHGLVHLSDLQAGASFESMDGAFTFSGFNFDPSGVDESALFDFLVAPADSGFKLLLGVGSPFGPNASLGITYKVTANGPLAISEAAIPRLQLLGSTDGTQQSLVSWQGSNGARFTGSSSEADPFEPISVLFSREPSLMVNETVTFSSALGIVWVENSFEHESVPEPGTGMLLAAGFGAWVVARRRSAV